jgi:hypothetical protein
MDALLEERRLVARVFRHWTEMPTAKRFPSKGDIDPWLLGDDWANCVLIRLDRDLDRSTFVTVGEKLLPEHAESLTDKSITACPRETLLGTMLKYLSRFKAIGGPLGIAGTANHHDAHVLFRALLLPVSSDGARIDYILGAANFRPLRNGEDKELRTRHQMAMLKVEKRQI